jgi:hypothetical protein
MKREVIASRIMYKLYLVVFVISILIFTIVFFIAFKNGAFEATVALAFYNSISFIFFFFYINKSVWIVMEGDLVHIGNLFINKKIHIQDVDSYNSFLFIPNFYSIRIDSSNYFFVSHLNRKSIKGLFSPQIKI